MVGNQEGNALTSSFNSPYDIAIDWINSPEIIYVADYGNNCIKQINQTSSIVSVLAGNCSISGYQDGALLSSLFNGPNSLQFLSTSSGTKILIADYSNIVIRMIDIVSGMLFYLRMKKIIFLISLSNFK